MTYGKIQRFTLSKPDILVRNVNVFCKSSLEIMRKTSTCKNEGEHAIKGHVSFQVHTSTTETGIPEVRAGCEYCDKKPSNDSSARP